jgi:hypothetical protein
MIPRKDNNKKGNRKMDGKVEGKIRDNDWEQREWESEKDGEGEKKKKSREFGHLQPVIPSSLRLQRLLISYYGTRAQKYAQTCDMHCPIVHKSTEIELQSPRRRYQLLFASYDSYV